MFFATVFQVVGSGFLDAVVVVGNQQLKQVCAFVKHFVFPVVAPARAVRTGAVFLATGPETFPRQGTSG